MCVRERERGERERRERAERERGDSVCVLRIVFTADRVECISFFLWKGDLPHVQQAQGHVGGNYWSWSFNGQTQLPIANVFEPVFTQKFRCSKMYVFLISGSFDFTTMSLLANISSLGRFLFLRDY